MKAPLILPSQCWCCGENLAPFQYGQLCLSCNLVRAELAAEHLPATEQAFAL